MLVTFLSDRRLVSLIQGGFAELIIIESNYNSTVFIL